MIKALAAPRAVALAVAASPAQSATISTQKVHEAGGRQRPTVRPRKGCLPAIGSPLTLVLKQINSSALDTKPGRGRQG